MSNGKNNARDQGGLPPEVRRKHLDHQNSTGAKGLYCGPMPEATPEYAKGGCEIVHKGRNNAFIILGRDRPGLPTSGEGHGGTQCGMIDIIAGMNSAAMSQKYDPKNPKHGADTSPSFSKDAARVYLTQRGNIDKYMGLAKGSEYSGASAQQSAVGIKGDHVRIVGRNHIKLVTGKMKQAGGGDGGERLSGGGRMDYAGGIDFIAGNYTDDEEIGGLSLFGSLASNFIPKVKKLQPLVKGSNLLDFFDDLLEILEELKGMITTNNKNILSLASTVSLHVHETNVPFGPTSPPIAAAASLIPVQVDGYMNISDSVINTFSMSCLKMSYLTSGFPKYINSRFVNTT